MYKSQRLTCRHHYLPVLLLWAIKSTFNGKYSAFWCQQEKLKTPVLQKKVSGLLFICGYQTCKKKTCDLWGLRWSRERRALGPGCFWRTPFPNQLPRRGSLCSRRWVMSVRAALKLTLIRDLKTITKQRELGDARQQTGWSPPQETSSKVKEEMWSAVVPLVGISSLPSSGGLELGSTNKQTAPSSDRHGRWNWDDLQPRVSFPPRLHPFNMRFDCSLLCACHKKRLIVAFSHLLCCQAVLLFCEFQWDRAPGSSSGKCQILSVSFLQEISIPRNIY